jgi:protein-L-isoaspartate(D-aspartate) O-methyltransferase
MLDSVQQRANMVATQLRTNDVHDPRLIKAVLEVAREDFAPEALKHLAYMDGCIPLTHRRVLLDARSFGKLAQLAAINPEDVVLDVGCGTGYSTAVFAKLASRVIGLEEDPALLAMARDALADVKNAELSGGRLSDGLSARAPFDVIFVNGAVERRPDALLAQLAEDGRLVCVFKDGAAGHGQIYVKHDGAIGERSAFDAQLPVLLGFEKVMSFIF